MLRATLAAVACMLAAGGSAVAEDGRWMLMSRHGECAEISVLARKVPDLGQVTSPAQFVQLLRERGLEVKRTDFTPDSVEIIVPKLELSPIFVRYETCSRFDKKVPKSAPFNE